ncbi:MAG: hypothetical protein ACLQVG_18235 [Terriglobia bacterium]
MPNMERYLSPIIFAADFAGAKTLTDSYRLVTALEAGFKEKWLQRAIAENIELVLGPCRSGRLIPRDERWRYWGSEVSLKEAGGISIDVLILSSSGRIGIVETKLEYNPEARREVVAQVLEYAIHFRGVIVEELTAQLPIPLGDDGLVFADPGEIQAKIEGGDYLLIIAGDQLDPRAVRLSSEVLGRHVIQGWDLALVEVSTFERKTESDRKEYLLVPHLGSAIKVDQRQVVNIHIDENRTRVEVEQTSAAVTVSRPPWTWESFVADAKDKNVTESTIVAMKKLHDGCKALSADIVWGTGTEYGSFNPKWVSICPRSVFQVSSSGALGINFYWLNTSETATSFRDELKEKVEQELKFIVPSDYRKKQPFYKDSEWAPKVDLLLKVLKELAPQERR